MSKALSSAQQLELLRNSPQDQDSATAALAEALSPEDETQRVEAARSLINELQVPTSPARWSALHLLQSAWWPVTPSLLPEVMKATVTYLQTAVLRGPEAEAATMLWAHLLRDNARASATLTSLLEHVSPTVRAAAAATAARLGEVALGAVPLLIAQSRSEPPEVAMEAASALAALAGRSGQSVGPALLQLVTTYTDGRRFYGLTGLRAMAGPDGAGLTEVRDLKPALLEAVKSESAAIRAEAVLLLGLLPASESGVKDALEARLADPASVVRVQAAVSLLRRGQLSSERAVEVLRGPLFGEGEQTAQATIVSLSALSPEVLASLKGPLEAAGAKAPPPVRAGVLQLFQPREA